MSTKGKSLDEIRADYLRVTAEIEQRIAGGPPPGSGIALEAWSNWHRHGFVCCPASKVRRACSDHQCRMGADCLDLRALGLSGSVGAASMAGCRRGQKRQQAAPASQRRSGGGGARSAKQRPLKRWVSALGECTIGAC
jgi:hypothetical protein